jgi:lysophospholipase L1-like esterase
MNSTNDIKLKIICLIFISIATITNASIRIVCVGDSLMANASDNTQPDQFGWAETLPLLFDESITITNNAVAGRSSRSYVTEGNWEDAKRIPCDYYFIQFGHNDSKTDDRYTDPETTYKTYLTQYITEARALGAIPILITPPARRVFTSDVELKKKNEPYANAMIEVAIALDVAYIDMFTITANYYEHWGESVSDAYGDNGDRTHFSYMGAKWCSRWVTSSLLWSEHASLQGLQDHITFEIPNQMVDIPPSPGMQVLLSNDGSEWTPFGVAITHPGGPVRVVVWAEHFSKGFARISYEED